MPVSVLSLYDSMHKAIIMWRHVSERKDMHDVMSFIFMNMNLMVRQNNSLSVSCSALVFTFQLQS